MQGLNEAIQTIQKTAVAATSPKELSTGSPHKTAYLIGDKVETFEHEPPPRAHTVYDLASLKSWCDENTPIWHDNDSVLVVLDDEGHRVDTVRMPLPLHPTFAAICNAPKNVDQKALITWLRLHLKDVLAKDHESLIGLVREIRIAQNVTGTGNVQHGRESMGKSIDNAVTGVDAIPEEVTLSVPLWLHHEATVQVCCFFDIDPSTVKFTFAPKPGEIAHAKAAGQRWLHEQLDTLSPNSEIYFGTPAGEEDGDCDD